MIIIISEITVIHTPCDETRLVLQVFDRWLSCNLSSEPHLNPSINWKHDICLKAALTSAPPLCLPDYDLPFQPQETNSFIMGILVHQTRLSLPPGDFLFFKSSAMQEKCQSDCEQLQPQLKNQPYCDVVAISNLYRTF